LTPTGIEAELIASQPVGAFDFNQLAHGETTLQFGGFIANQGKKQTIDIQDLVGSQYTVNSHTQRNGLVGLAYFVDGPDKKNYQLAYGLNIFYLAPTSITGYVVQELLYRNLSYAYTIQHLPLYFAAKAHVKTKFDQYKLIFDAGIGPNFMRTYDYHETPQNSVTIAEKTFTSRSNSTFAATAGVSARINPPGKTPLECGYRFFYLGEGRLTSNNSLLVNPLKTGHTFANALVCGVKL
jgi:hypothetical protein